MKTLSPVLRLFFVNWTLGVLLGLAFAGAILWFDVAGMFSLIRRSDMAVAATALLFSGFAFTCGGVVCASAIMRLPREEEPKHPAGPPLPAGLVPVRLQARRR